MFSIECSYCWFLKVHDLQTKLANSRDIIQQLKDQLNTSDAERRHFEQQAATYKLQIDELRRQFDDTANERDRSKSALETSNYERSNMEKIRLVNFIFFFKKCNNNCLLSCLFLPHFKDT